MTDGRKRGELEAASWKPKERAPTRPSAKPGERLPVPAQRDDSPRQGGNTPRHVARRTGGRRVEKEDHLRWLEQLRESQRLTTREEERKEKVLEILREIAETSARLDSGRGGRRQRSPTPSMSFDSQRSVGVQERPKAKPRSSHAVEAATTAIESLEAQRAAAEAEAERAARELAALSEQRAALALAVFSGKEGAAKELEEAEERATNLSRAKEAAEDAAREFARMIEEAGARRREEEEKRIGEERYDALAVERYWLDVRAQETLERLVDLLRQLDEVEREQEDAAEYPESEHAITLESWLKHNLGPWLGDYHGSEGVIDALPEADRRARRLEPGERS